jgi:hypothetical protein
MRVVTSLGALLLTVFAVVGCGGDGAAVTKVSVYEWPGVPDSGIVAGTEPGSTVPLSEIVGAIPDPLPDTLESQACESGAMVRITFEDGRTLDYGPCRRPSSIEGLRNAVVAAWRNG